MPTSILRTTETHGSRRYCIVLGFSGREALGTCIFSKVGRDQKVLIQLNLDELRRGDISGLVVAARLAEGDSKRRQTLDQIVRWV